MKTLEVGDVSITQVEEWVGLGLSPEAMFPGLVREDWDIESDWLAPQHFSVQEDRVRIVSETWLVRSAGRTILIDTGVGNHKPRPNFPIFDHFDGPYLHRLAEAGVKVDDVDLVIMTHLHVDHVGWNTQLVDGVWVPTFPNARYLLSEPDAYYWGPDYRGSRPGEFVNAGMFSDSVQPVIDAGLVDYWTDTLVIDENLTLEIAPGHTPGNAVVRIESDTEKAVFVGDMIHSPWQISHCEVSSCFCEDPAGAAASRQRILGWAADNSALILPAHFAGQNVCEVQRDGGRFRIKSWAAW